MTTSILKVNVRDMCCIVSHYTEVSTYRSYKDPTTSRLNTQTWSASVKISNSLSQPFLPHSRIVFFSTIHQQTRAKYWSMRRNAISEPDASTMALFFWILRDATFAKSTRVVVWACQSRDCWRSARGETRPFYGGSC